MCIRLYSHSLWKRIFGRTKYFIILYMFILFSNTICSHGAPVWRCGIISWLPPQPTKICIFFLTYLLRDFCLSPRFFYLGLQYVFNIIYIYSLGRFGYNTSKNIIEYVFETTWARCIHCTASWHVSSYRGALYMRE